ncbi:tRNA (adenosine(37)-N6)-dimethylallyltransferase MiaA [Candidatus Protochlamydia naegleriophila]|uniref:tRNA (adenosine(37)-N6)-dimethylallyltransferase MiaA n=1 Tax=Candidatus Protochlamydia naegleriophila TaxID=389348 RepID=UPI000509DE0F|nr:tRNA (adenosine(37)-N6)-dimethylallyltransferase MiaA [Candidatus Protochlamydia naegleriophila]
MIGETSVETEEVKRIILNFALEVQKQIPSNFQKRKKRVIVISGPTCCGKSALAMNLAQAMDGEIISADSMQVYRRMDIGTAKATKEERLLVPHHLIDIRDIQDSFNVVDFYYEARQAIQRILDEGNVPIVAGGSGFYLHALLYGPPSGPPSVPELRKSLEEEIECVGSDVLYERLCQLDPQYAKTITKNDKQKIVRALEIIMLTNKKVSKLSWKGRRKPQNYDFRCWFLHRPKEKLYERIDRRCDKMLDEGFLEEVRRLDLEGIRQNSSASQAIGYRQALDYLLTEQSAAHYDQFVKSFKQATRHYAKRQFTWFRKEPLFRWLDVDMHDPEVVFDMIMKDYELL